MPGFPVLPCFLEFAEIHAVVSGMLLTIASSATLFSFCPQSFPASGSVPVSQPSHQTVNFSFSISPSSDYSGLISFRIDWFDHLSVQGTLKSLFWHHSSKASVLWCSAFFMVQLSHPYMTTGKTVPWSIQTFVGNLMSAF